MLSLKSFLTGRGQPLTGQNIVILHTFIIFVVLKTIKQFYNEDF